MSLGDDAIYSAPSKIKLVVGITLFIRIENNRYYFKPFFLNHSSHFHNFVVSKLKRSVVILKQLFWLIDKKKYIDNSN